MHMVFTATPAAHISYQEDLVGGAPGDILTRTRQDMDVVGAKGCVSLPDKLDETSSYMTKAARRGAKLARLVGYSRVTQDRYST